MGQISARTPAGNLQIPDDYPTATEILYLMETVAV